MRLTPCSAYATSLPVESEGEAVMASKRQQEKLEAQLEKQRRAADILAQIAQRFSWDKQARAWHINRDERNASVQP